MEVTANWNEDSSVSEKANWRSVPEDEQKMILTTISNELWHIVDWDSDLFSYRGKNYVLSDLMDLDYLVDDEIRVIFRDCFPMNHPISRVYPDLDDLVSHWIDTGILLRGDHIVNFEHLDKNMMLVAGDVDTAIYGRLTIDHDKCSDGGVRYSYTDLYPDHPDYDSEVIKRTHHHIERFYSGGYWYPSPASELPEYLTAVDHPFLSKNVWLFIQPPERMKMGQNCRVYLWVGPWTHDGTLPFFEETSSNLTFPFEPWARPHVVAHAMTQHAAVDFDISDREESRILEQAIRDTLFKIAVWNSDLKQGTTI